MPFTFSLEILLKLTREKLDLLKEEHRKLKEQLVYEKAILKDLEELKLRHREGFLRKCSKMLSSLELLSFQRFLTALQGKIDRQREKVSSLEGVLKEKEGEILKASLNLRLLEKLREREFSHYKVELRREESRRLDEFGQRLKRTFSEGDFVLK